MGTLEILFIIIIIIIIIEGVKISLMTTETFRDTNKTSHAAWLYELGLNVVDDYQCCGKCVSQKPSCYTVACCKHGHADSVLGVRSVLAGPQLYWKTQKADQAQKWALWECTHKGDNQRCKYVAQVQQQRPESATATITWHACKYKVH